MSSNSFSKGTHQPRVCLQRAKIILGVYKCNYSLTVKELKLHLALEGNREANVAPVTMSLTPVLRAQVPQGRVLGPLLWSQSLLIQS